MSPILEDRLALLAAQPLEYGAHSEGAGMCAMEAASWIAGEPWSDEPDCVCPTIGAFMRSWNDGLPNDAERDRLLKPFIPKVIGTKGSPALAEARGYLALDWLVRVYTPAWLELKPELRSHAQALRALEVLRDTPSVLAVWCPGPERRQGARTRGDARTHHGRMEADVSAHAA